MGTMLIADCGLRNADSCPRFQSAIRNPQSAIRVRFKPMPVQAIAWSPSGAVRIVDQRALPEDFATRDLESVAAVADPNRQLPARGAPLIGIAAAMGLVVGMREDRPAAAAAFLANLERHAGR